MDVDRGDERAAAGEVVRAPGAGRVDARDAPLSVLAVTLLKGVLQREDDERLWASLQLLQSRLRDFVAVLGLELVFDEAEGHAFLRSRPDDEADDDAPDAGGTRRAPRLVARRPLSYPVSLLLALLRKKLAEFDAGGGDTRLVLSLDDIVETVRVFLPDGPNEARLVDQVESHVNRIVDLGFLRRLTPAAGSAASAAAGGACLFEVRRILKAYVDAQWLADFEARLQAYRGHLAGEAARAPARASRARGAGEHVGEDL
jgi:hypothetical protein